MGKIKDKIEDIFNQAEHQEEALNEIYKLFIPNWDKIFSIDGWPSCGSLLHRFISERFVAFDIKRHPDVMAGGLWLNRGFSEDLNLKDWEVSLSTCRIKTDEATDCFT